MEGPDIAFPDKSDVDASFARCMKVLLDSGVFHGLATRDERMNGPWSPPRDAFELQLLYGIREGAVSLDPGAPGNPSVGEWTHVPSASPGRSGIHRRARLSLSRIPYRPACPA
ncbi:hypothetical protein ACN469_22660 [Corallococcus terminator]